MKTENIFYQITVAVCTWRESLRTDGSFRTFRPGTSRMLKTKAFPSEKAAMRALAKLGDVKDPQIEMLEHQPESTTWKNTLVWKGSKP